jgi:hypothetical protein
MGINRRFLNRIKEKCADPQAHVSLGMPSEFAAAEPGKLDKWPNGEHQLPELEKNSRI